MRLKVMGRAALVVVVSAGAAAFYRQHQISRGLDGYARGDFTTAYAALAPFNGWYDASAQLRLAEMLSKGEGVRENDVQAFNMARTLASSGKPDAAPMLAGMYDKGAGTTADPMQALTWYKVAANAGDAASQLQVGERYEAGVGIAQDYGQAASWYVKAANSGIAAAQTRLGKLYLAGRGVPKDTKAAIGYFTKAIAQSDSEAAYELGNLYVRGNDPDLSFDQALAYLKVSAIAGNRDAQYSLGALYAGAPLSGDRYNELQDFTLAYALFDLAASNGSNEAKIAAAAADGATLYDIVSLGQSLASNWHVGSPLPTPAFDDYAAQSLLLDSELPRDAVPHTRIWFGVDWTLDGNHRHADFFKQVGSMNSYGQSDPGTCHACDANISVVTFSAIKSDSDFQRQLSRPATNIQLNFAHEGAYGDVAPSENDNDKYEDLSRAGQKLYPMGRSTFLVLTPFSYTGQGETSRGYNAFVYHGDDNEETGGRWIDTGGVMTHSDNSGDCGHGPGEGSTEQCYSWDGNIEVSTTLDGWPEIRVVANGTMPDDRYQSTVPTPNAFYTLHNGTFVSPTKVR